MRLKRLGRLKLNDKANNYKDNGINISFSAGVDYRYADNASDIVFWHNLS